MKWMVAKVKDEVLRWYGDVQRMDVEWINVGVYMSEINGNTAEDGQRQMERPLHSASG